MEIPFLKNKNKLLGSNTQEVHRKSEETDENLLNHISDELFEAIERKDLKSLRESLTALVLELKGR